MCLFKQLQSGWQMKAQGSKKPPSVAAEACASGSAHNSAPLGFGFALCSFLFRGVCLARRSEATPTCIKKSTRLGARNEILGTFKA